MFPGSAVIFVLFPPRSSTIPPHSPPDFVPPRPLPSPACPGKNLLCIGKLRVRTSNLLEGGCGLNVPDKNLRFISICFPNKGIQICFTSFTKKKTAVLRPIQSQQHPSLRKTCGSVSGLASTQPVRVGSGGRRRAAGIWKEMRATFMRFDGS